MYDYQTLYQFVVDNGTHMHKINLLKKIEACNILDSMINRAFSQDRITFAQACELADMVKGIKAIPYTCWQ